MEVDASRQDAILKDIQQARGCSYRDTIEVSEANFKDEFEEKVFLYH